MASLSLRVFSNNRSSSSHGGRSTYHPRPIRRRRRRRMRRHSGCRIRRRCRVTINPRLTRRTRSSNQAKRLCANKTKQGTRFRHHRSGSIRSGRRRTMRPTKRKLIKILKHSFVNFSLFNPGLRVKFRYNNAADILIRSPISMYSFSVNVLLPLGLKGSVIPLFFLPFPGCSPWHGKYLKASPGRPSVWKTFPSDRIFYSPLSGTSLSSLVVPLVTITSQQLLPRCFATTTTG